MSKTRLDFHNKLLEICDNVYFQAPRDDKMVFPCIKYEMMRPSIVHANNHIYKHTKRYQVEYITKDPDDPIIDALLYFLPHTDFDRQYKSNNIYHNVYEIYF